MAKKPKTTVVSTVKGGGGRYDSLNEGIKKLNESLAGGITGVKNTDGSTIKGKVYFTPGGATSASGKKMYTSNSGTKTTGNTTGVTANPKNTEVTEPGVVSSVQGESQLKQYQSDVVNLDVGLGTKESPLSDTQILDLEKQGIVEGDIVPGKGRLHPGGYWTGDIPAPTETGDVPSATYIDPATGATTTTTGTGAGSTEEQNKMKEKGFSLSESSTPAESTDTPEIKALKEELDSATKEADSFKNKLLDLIVTDADLKDDIRGITKAYNARIAEMRDINSRQIQGVKTLGYRMGAQFTGGFGGVWGGIISDAERQGLMKITDIETQKQETIIKAKAAARESNYKIYASLMEDARTLQKEKSVALADLKKAQAEQDRKIAERKNQIENDTIIADFYTQGITSAQDIMNAMNVGEDGTISGRVTLEEVEKSLKILNPPDALKGLDADYQTFNYLQKINDPSVRGLSWIDYQRTMANLKAAANGANKSTLEERKVSAKADLAPFLQPYDNEGNRIKIPGTSDYFRGEDGYIGEDGLSYLLDNAYGIGLERNDIIDMTAHLINPVHRNPSDLTNYGLAPLDIQYYTGVKAPQPGAVDTELQPNPTGY